mgnify:CR=1 FL=1
MKNFKYFIQFCLTIFSFLIFKILGPNLSSKLSGKIFELIGPFFRSRQIIHSNIKKQKIVKENCIKYLKFFMLDY